MKENTHFRLLLESLAYVDPECDLYGQKDGTNLTIPLLLLPGRSPLMPVGRIEAGYKLLQVGAGQRILLERVVDVGAVIVKSDQLRPRPLPARLTVKKEYVGLDPMGVKDARRQAQNGV
jgi:hypothetical protein